MRLVFEGVVLYSIMLNKDMIPSKCIGIFNSKVYVSSRSKLLDIGHLGDMSGATPYFGEASVVYGH